MISVCVAMSKEIVRSLGHITNYINVHMYFIKTFHLVMIIICAEWYQFILVLYTDLDLISRSQQHLRDIKFKLSNRLNVVCSLWKQRRIGYMVYNVHRNHTAY